MALTENNLHFMQAERMTDFDDGGGRMSGRHVVDGRMNDVFDDIPGLSNVYSNVSIRKIYLAVLSALNEVYLGANVIISGRPKDPNVSVSMFTTKSWTDTRTEARNQLENYLNRAGRWTGWLLEKQLKGQRVINVWQRVDVELPAMGAVWCLVENRDKAEEQEQYIKIARIVENKIRTFSDDQGEYQRRVLALEITDPLRYDFNGATVSRMDSAANSQSKSVILQTVVADAAHYYGCNALAQDAKLGQMLIKTESIFTQLVPTARAETPIVDANAAGDNLPLVASAKTDVRFSYGADLSPSASLYLGTGCYPGTLKIIVNGATLTDQGGELYDGTTAIGIVNYARGTVQINPAGQTYRGTKNVSFRPSAPPSRTMETSSIDVTLESRGSVYVQTLVPTPTPGSLTVSYRAQNNWYDLTDNGSGELHGADVAYGAGQINYSTGSVNITTGALPDVDSEIIFSWATPVSFFDRSELNVLAPAFYHTLSHKGIAQNTLSISWVEGTDIKTATDDGKGNLRGDATGTIRYQTGDLVFRPKNAPMGGVDLVIDYQWGEPSYVEFPMPLRGSDGRIRIELPDTDIIPNTVDMSFNVDILDYDAVSMLPAELQMDKPIDPIKSCKDNGAGGFNAEVNGMIDYTTGAIDFLPETMVQIPIPVYRVTQIGTSNGQPVYRNQFVGWSYKNAGAQMPYDESGWVHIYYRASSANTAVQETVTVNALWLDFTEGYAERICSGSLRFTYGGKTYLDQNGNIITDFDPATGASTLAGVLDYQSGNAMIRIWTPQATGQIKIESLLTEIGGHPIDAMVFRIPIAPVRPGSLSIMAATLTGGMVRVDTNLDSEFKNGNFDGTVDYVTGVVKVRFGLWVTASGNEGQVWYDPDAVQNGKIFKPIPVYADTVRYNAVGYTYLPLDADILGLDTVRLPSDGRVPIFRTGDVVVIQHDAVKQLPPVLEVGKAYDVGRTRLSRMKIVDSLGVEMPAERYETDLDLGTVTLNAPLNMTGLSSPLSVEHRIEDAALAYDVQINGNIALTRPLSHNFPAGETLVSSALVVGNMQARVDKLFSQQTWQNVWQDHIGGAATTSQYNSIQYPVIVTNEGAIQERWAFIFTSTTAFRIVGESLGQIGEGSINSDCKPINPYSGTPYFELKAAGWGGGWAAGNVLRFNTPAANFPVYLARTVLMGTATTEVDSCQIQGRGDASRTK